MGGGAEQLVDARPASEEETAHANIFGEMTHDRSRWLAPPTQSILEDTLGTTLVTVGLSMILCENSCWLTLSVHTQNNMRGENPHRAGCSCWLCGLGGGPPGRAPAGPRPSTVAERTLL